MILLNFSHPLTPAQQEQVERLTDQPITQTIEIPSQIEPQEALGPQVVRMADAAALSPAQWQGEPLLINPPALNYSAVLLLAELHGRMGYFPTCLRLRPIPGSTPPRFEVAEVLNTNELREAARRKR